MRSEKRIFALLLSAALTLGCTAPALAADDGVTTACDEAYYGKLDYYGNLTEGSVVKSYILNGAAEITDYGRYDEVTSLTDGVQPAVDGDRVTFDLTNAADSHFYFEGVTAKPFEALPWTVEVHYKLNGVPVKAEELAGKAGLVEIDVGAYPNEGASDYAKNNYTLEVASMFNQDKILSLEAPGAQIQLIGNLRAVLFMGLPGEEEHFEIRVGTEDFSFSGLTIMMVPATLGQMEKLSELAEKRDEIEDSYHKLNDSLDALLDSLSGVGDSLRAAANGLDQIDAARVTLKNGKDAVKAKGDALRADLDEITASLTPISDDMATASRAVTDISGELTATNEHVQSLRAELDELTDIIDSLQSKGGDVRSTRSRLRDVRAGLGDLEDSLDSLGSFRVGSIDPLFGGRSSAELQSALQQAVALHDSFEQAGGDPMDFNTFAFAMMSAQNMDAAAIQQLLGLYAQLPSAEAAAAMGLGEQWAAVDNLHSAFAYGAQGGDSLDFSGFMTAAMMLKGYSAQDASSNAASLAELYELYEASPDAAEQLLGRTDALNGEIGKVNGAISRAGTAVSGLSGASTDLMGDLSGLLKDVDGLYDLLDDVDDLGDLSADGVEKVRTILTDIDSLKTVLDGYEPQLQSALGNVTVITDTLIGTLNDTGAFVDSLEDLMDKAGPQMDSGAAASMKALSQTLRSLAKTMDATSSIRSAKDAVTDIVEDVWDEYAGETSNLLNMDPNAPKESLTDSRNPEPETLQVLLRTQEIKAEEKQGGASAEETAKTETNAEEKSNLWTRFSDLFKGMFAAVIGLFR